jgi:acyl-CoA dehydrogenase
VPSPFAEILAHTMVPVAHILWGSGWLGRVAHHAPGSIPPQAVALSKVATDVQVMRAAAAARR